jgi:hypothetical protein
MRMHSLALQMMMSQDVKKTVGYFGFKRNIKYSGLKPQVSDEELDRQENYWNEA